MRLIQTMAVVVVVGAAGSARAQGGVPFSPFDGLDALGIGVMLATASSSALFTGSLATWQAVKGRPSARVLVPATLLGAAHLASGIVLIHEGTRSGWYGFRYDGTRSGWYGFRYGGIDSGLMGAGIAASVVGLWNLVMPLIAVVRSGASEEGRVTATGVAPVFLTGKTASGTGRRWSGLGLQVSL